MYLIKLLDLESKRREGIVVIFENLFRVFGTYLGVSLTF